MTAHWLPPELAAKPRTHCPVPSLDPRPRDFARRILRGAGRRRTRIARRRRSLAGALLTMVALPAFVAPGQWSPFAQRAGAANESAPHPMPFETAAGSFPGAAFYYLDLAPVPARIGSGIHSDADDSGADTGLAPLPGPGTIGPAARTMVVDDTPLDHARALQCLTQAVYYEAASEPDAGQRAVAQVVLNRVAHRAYPSTVCGVVYQGARTVARAGSQRPVPAHAMNSADGTDRNRPTGCQFTFTCDGSLSRKPVAMFWDRARAVAKAALAGYVYAPVGLATHYHTVQVHPGWSDSLRYLETIGAHRFYALNGPAGAPGAFRFVYRGGEPAPGIPQRESRAELAADAIAADPVALQKAYAKADPPDGATPDIEPARHAPAAAPPRSEAAPPPTYSDAIRERGGDALYRAHDLPQSGIRAPYARSGAWISPTSP